MSLAAVLLTYAIASLTHAGLIFWAFGRPGGTLRREAMAGGAGTFAAVMGRFQAAAAALAASGVVALIMGAAAWR
ncbi:MAG: hypothetical protein JF588_12865 [Caulobacterales bacterium]|nr:hypothetical protein [Caulobacterales bacterium]